jgi:putative DNA primase/helicase
LAKKTVNSILIEAINSEDEAKKQLIEWARSSAARFRLDAMIALARSEGTILKSMNDFDRDAHLFNCQNGIVDLRDGTLCPHDRKALMMRISPASYDPEAQCPTWFRFLARVQREDPEMISFLQRLAGYSMWGTGKLEKMFFLFGNGRNGKGKFLLTLQRILGNYADTIPFATFLEGAKHSAGGPNESIAKLVGKRLAIAQESKPTGRFNEALLLALTGGDRVSAQFKYGHEFEFEPQFTLILAANHKPKVIDQTEAIKSRIVMVPFSVRIPEEERDLDLADKLWAERDGILAWCVKGAVEWNARGIAIPRLVTEASKEYFVEQDAVGQWLAECTERGPHEAPAGLAYDSFKSFAKENGFFAKDSREFKKELEDAGFRHKKGKTCNLWVGFRVTRMGSERLDHALNGVNQAEMVEDGGGLEAVS